MLGFDVGPPEIIIVLLLVLLLFGAKRLPEIGKGMGKGIKEFRDATKGLHDDVKSGMEDKPTPPANDDRNAGGTPPAQ